MEIIKKMTERSRVYGNVKVPTIAFFGDSVTQGCFEVFMENERDLQCITDYDAVYHSRVRKIFSILFPTVPVNIINAGLSGDNATNALTRIQRDVLQYSPDLTVVCFGLNDANFGEEALNKYLTSLRGIFKKLSDSGSEIIFMTPNMMNTYISNRLSPPVLAEQAEKEKRLQTEGFFDAFLDGAKAICKEFDIPVCDCYAKWKMLYENGVDITELLSNKVNHPLREMHLLFAGMLVNTMFEN